MAYEIKIETGSSVQSVDELKKHVDELKASLNSLTQSTEEYAKVSQQIADAEKQLATATQESSKSLKDVISSTNQAGTSLDNAGKKTKTATDNFKIMRDEIKQLKSDFAGTTAGTEEYDTALLALSNKMRDFNDMNKMIRASAADTGQILGNITGTAQGIAGGFEAASGALELFGVSTASLQDAEKRTMGIIKVVQGLAAAEDGLTKKLPYLVKQYQSINAQIKASISARKSAKAATDAETVADTAQATASKTAAQAETAQAAGATAVSTTSATATASTFTFAGAIRALTAAIAANPLGLILVGLTTLISLLPAAISGISKLFNSNSGANNTEANLKNVETQLDNIQQKAKIQLEIKKIQSGNLDPVEELNLEIDSLKKTLNDLENEYSAAQYDLFKEMAKARGKRLKELQTELDETSRLFRESITGIQADIKKLEDSRPVAEARKQANDDAAAKRAVEQAASQYRARNEELKRFLENLEDSFKTQEELETKAYEKQQAELEDSLKRKLISQEKYDSLLEKTEQEHQDNLAKIRKDAEDKEREAREKAEKERQEQEKKRIQEQIGATGAKVQNTNNSYNNNRNILSSDYDKLIAMSNSEVEQADLSMQKEQALFNIKKQNIEEQIKLYSELQSQQTAGSEEYAKTSETLKNLNAELVVAENEHAVAVVEGEKKKQDAIQKTEDALKQQVKAYVDAISSIVDQISNLIGIYADEAKERANNEELSIEAREKALEESKKYQIAQTIISTLQGIVSAWSSAMALPTPMNYITGSALSALMTAIGAKNIQKIQSQKLGGSASSISGSGNSANIQMPTYSGPADNIAVQRPLMENMRVYVLEQDISEKQTDARVRVEEATF